MLEVCIVGAKNSGKTTLIERIVRLLTSQGKKVATVKHTGHDHTFDTAGKDTFKHRRAGSEVTMAIGNAETAVFADPIVDIVAVMRNYLITAFDWCLTEGDKKSTSPKVLLTRNIESMKQAVPDNVIVTYGETIIPGYENFRSHQTLELLEFLEQHLAEDSKGGMAL